MCSASEAEGDFSAKKQQQQLVKDQNPSRFYTRFLFKAFIVATLCIALHLFTSQAPEFSNQTRIFEFLHLIIVGIAVSYGLFSRKTDETGKENGNSHSTFDNAHLYISRLLQVSSDENENESGPSDGNRVQTWSNQYHRSESEVVVAENSNQSITGNNRARIGNNKPLLLPVRSLKTRVSNADSLENSRPLNRARSNLDSRRFSRTFSEISVVGGSNNHPDSPKEKNLNKINNRVLPSPIPWRSRSGRMEDAANSFLDESFGSSGQDSVSSSPKSKRSQSFPSPKEFTSLPSETLGKLEEDFPSKKSFYSACPPPPPPPPPAFYKAAPKKELPRNYGNETRHLDEDVRDGLIRPRGGRLIEDSSATANIVKVGLSRDPILKKDGIFENGFGESPRKSSGFDQESSKKNDESTKAYLSNKSLVGSRKEDSSSKFVEKVVMETEEEDDDDDDDDGEDNHDHDVVYEEDTHSEEGPDVDKKADEFIAKFREQIRLQRIESIKRSATAAQMRKNSSSR